MKKYDVVIIGAGPAGASAAKYFEEVDRSYIIVDKEQFPRNKPCAGVLSPKINSILKIPKEICERPLTGYRIFSPLGTMVESSFPEAGSIVRRDLFDNFLVQSLKNKPANVNINEISEKNECLEVHGKDWKCKSRFIIGADGANSMVKKHLKIPSKQIAIAAQYEVSLPQKVIDKQIGNWFEIYYTLKYGYGWISPMKSSLKVGVGILSDHLDGNIFQILDKFIKYPIIKEKISNGKIVRKEAHIIPMSGPLDKLAGKRTTLTGDAGGFVYPGTGEGIYYAIKTGRIAAQIIDRSLNNNDFASDSLEENYLFELEKNGLLSLRNIDFIGKYLTYPKKTEKYVKRLKSMI